MGQRALPFSCVLVGRFAPNRRGSKVLQLPQLFQGLVLRHFPGGDEQVGEGLHAPWGRTMENLVLLWGKMLYRANSPNGNEPTTRTEMSQLPERIAIADKIWYNSVRYGRL